MVVTYLTTCGTTIAGNPRKKVKYTEMASGNILGKAPPKTFPNQTYRLPVPVCAFGQPLRRSPVQTGTEAGAARRVPGSHTAHPTRTRVRCQHRRRAAVRSREHGVLPKNEQKRVLLMERAQGRFAALAAAPQGGYRRISASFD